jgi:hypothetical protein
MQNTRSRDVSVRVVTLTLVWGLAAAAQTGTPIQKFVGVWVEDESKLQLGDSAGKLRFREAAGGGLEELRGAEAAPLAQPVKFEGKPYAIGGSVNTIEWKKTDDRHYERKIYHEGKLQAVRNIEISADGKTLTEITKRTPTGGQKSTVIAVFERTSGGPQGLVGVWPLRSVKTTPPPMMRIEAAGTDGYKVSDDAGRTYTVKLDGKPVAVAGPTVIAGTMIAARAIDDHTIEESDSGNGTPTGKTTMALSADGTTLTATSVRITPKGEAAPAISVYRKR